MFSFKEFVNKKILIFGYGKTGKSVEKFFKKKNIRHSIWDDKIKNKKFDKNFYIKKYDFIVLSPGIDIYHHKKKKFFKKHKSKIITDLDIFFSLPKNYKYTIGITGTNGKSSFCNLLKLILKKNKINSKIIGNFGNPVLEGDFSEKKYYIIELSSYQLDYSKYIKLNSACILNVSPDHLERHLNLKNYKKIKLKIFKFLKEQGKGFYHKSSFPNYRSKLNIKYFKNINKNLISNIIGKKIKISKKILNANILPHRNELFFKKNNFNFVNDSKSTNFDSTRFAIKKNKNVYLILGGLLKKGDNYNIKDLNSKIKKIYIFGKNTKILKKSFNKQKISYNYFKDLKNVLKDFYNKDFKYKNNLSKKYTLLFSPGGASFDQYKNFEHRGAKFKKYIYELFKR